MRVKPFFIAVILTFSVGLTGVAGDDSPAFPGSIDPEEDEQELPSDELLDFLGQWETDKGQWVDPGNLDWLMQPGSGQNYEN